MKVERTIIAECGCVAVFDGVFQGYIVEEHTCDGTVLKAKVQAAKEFHRHLEEQSAKILRAPLNGNKGFSLLR